MSRVISIGTDLHSMGRFRTIIAKGGGLDGFKTKRFGQRVLHPKYELPIFQMALQRGDFDQCSKLLSVSWCLKEAIYKTLDSDDQKQFKMTQWYKINDSNGRPIIGVDQPIYPKSEQFLCSITHDADLVSAFVLRQSL